MCQASLLLQSSVKKVNQYLVLSHMTIEKDHMMLETNQVM